MGITFYKNLFKTIFIDTSEHKNNTIDMIVMNNHVISKQFIGRF